ncbi:MAG: NADP-dependent oxidoreductase [Candidatus Dormibacteraeota bacterium]|uniref:NADP-dependent oxidoreductase n=1 Tax=Candidatus Amunia macphersoniae TaxID=3127014 RepID=A0A934KAJ9_9BACT|nr:NADP-dependent oxidoreductase [Candidatus Dormibacteraeota bacterium]
MTISGVCNRQIHLAARPNGEAAPDNFSLHETEVRPPADGEVVVRNHLISVDPYMRGRMNDVKSYVPPYQVGEVLDGGALGEVIESRSPELNVGDTVTHNYGWREYATAKAGDFRAVDTGSVPATAHLNALSMIGLTAWVGLVEIAQLKQGDIVFVSGAGGAVGSIAGQIARLRGASRVIGSTGSDQKVSWLREELGFDAAFNYKNGPIRKQLADAAPDGIDVYFDNVGGEHLEAAIGASRSFGRMALCGAISQYNATTPVPGPRNLTMCVGKRLTLRGFIVIDHNRRMAAFVNEVGPWIADGSVVTRETIVDGIENAPQAFLGLMRGDNTGKMLVRVSG